MEGIWSYGQIQMAWFTPSARRINIEFDVPTREDRATLKTELCLFIM